MEISMRNGVAMVGKSSGVLCTAYQVVALTLEYMECQFLALRS